MRKATQTSFFATGSEFSASRISHGGGMAAGKRKVFRPLDRRKSLHIMLKSSHAKGRLSFLGMKTRLKIDEIVRERAKESSVTIHLYENVGNHLHFIVSFAAREGLQKFLRMISGLIARLVTGARRGHAFGQRFWDSLAFTRVITGRRDFESMMRYLGKNSIERDHGRPLRYAVELREQALREAKQLGITLKEVMDRWLFAEVKKPKP